MSNFESPSLEHQPEHLSDAGPQSKRRFRRLGRWAGTSFFFVVVLFLLANNFVTLPYYVFAPGTLYPITRELQIPADKTFPHQGDTYMTTVALRQGHPIAVLYALVSPTQRVEKRAVVSGDLSQKEFKKINEAEMATSQQEAIEAAMTRSGYKVTLRGNGALVKQLVEGAPLANLVQPGEVIEKVNGKEIKLAPDLIRETASLKPGDKVSLVVRGTGGELRTVEVTAAPHPRDATRALLGVVVTTDNPSLETPFPVKFNQTDVGGPSAGLGFTLALIDSLTPGELMGGKMVATTGTIDAAGNVGEVGGVAQKAAAVESSEAKLFLVPASEVSDAKSAVGNKVKVVGVNNIDDALRALKENGGDISGVPTVSK